MELTDAQWATIELLIPTPRRRKDGRGRPWRNPRGVLGGILWVLRTGAEVTLVEGTIDSGFLVAVPERLIGDRAYDSDGLVSA